MGSNLSHIVDLLYPVPSGDRLETFKRLLAEDQNLYSGLITASKSAELNISLQPLKKGKQKPSLPRNLKDDPLIWRPDESTIEQWSRNTSTFWTSPAWTVTFNEGRLASIYERAIALQTRHGQDVLRFRFLFVFFHDLLCYLYPQHSKSAPASVYDRIVKIISTEGCNDLCVDEINSKVRDWVNRGRRYHKLTETFGDGILIELPVDVSRDAVEKRLPLEDVAAFYEAVNGITNSKLAERAEANGSNILGKKIRQSALEPFKFLQEDPKSYTTRRPSIHLAQRNRPKKFRSRHNGKKSSAAADSVHGTAGSAGQHRDGLGRPKRRRLDPDEDSWSPPVGSRNAGLPRDTDGRTDYAGLLLAAAGLNEHEHERSELSLEDGGINGETNVSNGTTVSASPSNERVKLGPGHKTSLVEVDEPSDSEQTESNLVETRGPYVAQYSQLRTTNNAFGVHLSEPIQPDKASSALTHSTLSALATGDNNQSPSAPSSTDSSSVAHEVQGWQPMQDNMRWPRSGQDDHQGSRPYNPVSTVQPFEKDAMGTEQPQDYRTATNQNRCLQVLETFPTPYVISHECDNLRTTSTVGIGMVTGGVAPQSFCQRDQASSLTSGSTHGAHGAPGAPGARTTFDFGSRQEFSVTDEQTPQFVEQSWGMNNAIALPQQLLRMPEEEHRHQGSWEQNWGFDNAILLSQQPQGTSMEENQTQGPQEQNLGMNNAGSTSRHSPWEVNGRTPNVFPVPQQSLGTAQQTNSGPFWQQTSRMGGSIPTPQKNSVRDELNSQPLPWEQHWGMTNGISLPQQNSDVVLVDRVWE